MRLTGGPCSSCGGDTCESVLWAGDLRLMRVWCCELCRGNLNADVRNLLTFAARQLEQERERAPQLH